jgi:YwiC-like protein
VSEEGRPELDRIECRDAFARAERCPTHHSSAGIEEIRDAVHHDGRGRTQSVGVRQRCAGPEEHHLRSGGLVLGSRTTDSDRRMRVSGNEQQTTEESGARGRFERHRRDTSPMLPREHGAYGQLLFPLVTALAVGGPTVAACGLAVAGIALFVAHEPLLVVMGQRGVRAEREQTRRAWRWLAGSVLVATVSGTTALLMASASTRVAIFLPIVFAVVVAGFIAARREHTMAGEILSAVALSSLSLPVGLAAGVSVRTAASCAVVFSCGFALATVSVRMLVIGRRDRPEPSVRWVVAFLAALFLVGVWGLERTGFAAPQAVRAVVPFSAAAAMLAAVAPSPRRLRYVGWGLMLASAASVAILIGGLR